MINTIFNNNIILEIQESKIVSTEGLVPLYCVLAANLKKPTHARSLCQNCKKKKGHAVQRAGSVTTKLTVRAPKV